MQTAIRSKADQENIFITCANAKRDRDPVLRPAVTFTSLKH